jgi:lipopolysaccharide export system permease protein
VKLLDRYVLRNFLRAYLYCIAAFVSIWLVYDMSDNVGNFLDERVPFSAVMQYYLTQIPQVLVIILPVSLLLALLFVLGRMSRTNEIVSMLTTGISIPRLIAPLIVVGLVTTAAMALLNYSLAPRAERMQKGYFDAVRGQARESSLTAHVFRNRAENRTWFIQHFRPESNQLTTVQVLQQDENGNIVTNHLAASAVYHTEVPAWELRNAKIVRYDAAGNITDDESHVSITITDWKETPFRLASTNLRAEYLTVPELRSYLRFNADFPQSLLAPFATQLQHRAALPWSCLVVVLIAAPLAIGFSRGGLLSSVAAAIGLVFLMNFLTHLFLALGEGDRIAAWAAAWTPNILFASVGLVLLFLRSTNRDLRSLNPFATRALPAR